MAEVKDESAYPKPVYAWYVLFIICFAYVFAFLDRIVVGLLTPAIQADLGITDTQAGLLQGLAFAIFYTLFGLPLGWYVDRISRKKIFGAGMVVWCAMTAVCGLATNFWQLFLARVGVGVGEATINPCSSSLISDYFPPSKRPRAFAFFTMSTAIGTILSYVFGSFVIAALVAQGTITLPVVGELQPWQVTFIAVGLPGLIPAVLFYLTVREPTRLGVATSSGPPLGSMAEKKVFLAKNRKALGCMLVAAGLIILEIYGTVFWMPTYFLRAHGWPVQQTALYVGVAQGFAGICGAYWSGATTSWFKKRGVAEGVWMTSMIGAIGTTVFGSLAPLMPTAGLALVVFVTKSFFVNHNPASALTAINELTPNQHRGFVTALYVILTGLIAQGFGSVAVGASTDYVFGDPAAVGQSLSLVVFVTGVIAVLLLLYSRSAYRERLSAVTWEPAAKPA